MEEKKSFSWVWWLITLILACTAVGIIVHNNSDKIDNILNKEVIEDTTTVDTVTTEEPVTIQEILEFREHLRECQRIDSVFMSLPEVVLIDILMNHGTNLSNSDIVYIYESNPDTYNAVKSGARAQQYKEKLERNEPDTIPEKPAIDQPISLTF